MYSYSIEWSSLKFSKWRKKKNSFYWVFYWNKRQFSVTVQRSGSLAFLDFSAPSCVSTWWISVKAVHPLCTNSVSHQKCLRGDPVWQIAVSSTLCLSAGASTIWVMFRVTWEECFASASVTIKLPSASASVAPTCQQFRFASLHVDRSVGLLCHLLEEVQFLCLDQTSSCDCNSDPTAVLVIVCRKGFQ